MTYMTKKLPKSPTTHTTEYRAMMAMAVTTEGPPPAGAQGPPPPALPLAPPQGSERFQPAAAEPFPQEPGGAAAQGGAEGRQAAAEALATNGSSRAPARSGAEPLPSR